MSEFVKVGKVGEFPPGRGRMVSLDGVAVAVFRQGERWFALQDSCPHMGASLSDGKLEGESVVCHWHDWKFDLHSGQGDQRSWARARVYEVRIDGDDVLLKPPPDEPEPPEEPGEDDDWIRWDDSFLKSSD
jgi:nitrite reductase (NADH) small subunit/3-phenylpropionate/trans-cinnamate dioxygenase ferredoxin subunit